MPLTQVQGGMILPSTTLTTPIVATTMGVGGATPAASGSGITFPATQSASSDANTLDDYEEGTFTPTVQAGFTSPTYGVQQGRYTKIGRMCYFSIYITVNGGTRNSNMVQTSLPFTSGATTGSFAGGAYWTYASPNIVNSVSTNLPTLYITTETNRVDFYKTDGNTFNGTDFVGSTPSIYLTGWYETA